LTSFSSLLYHLWYLCSVDCIRLSTN